MSDFLESLKSQTEIKAIQLSESTQLRVTVNRFKDGRTAIDVRQFYRKQRDPQYMPGKGVSVPPEILKSLRIALKKAEDEAAKPAPKAKKAKK